VEIRQQLPFIASCIYGLEQVLAEEVKDRLGVESSRSWCQIAFQCSGDVSGLRELATAQNVFLQLSKFSLKPGAAERIVIREQLERMPLETWLKLCNQLNASLESSCVKIDVRRKGVHAFSYRYVADMLAEIVRSRLGMSPAESESPLELAAEIKGEHVLVKGRLFPRPLSRRSYLVRRFTGATEPSVARAMARLSQPRPDDTILDPCCGCGTIPLERALEKPFKKLVAGDIRDKRVQETIANAAAARVELEAATLDAFNLPFADRSFNRIITHPPQSNPQTGTPWSVADFKAMLGELFRVLDYGGLMLLYGVRPRLMKFAHSGIVGAQPRKSIVCVVSGKRRYITFLSKDI